MTSEKLNAFIHGYDVTVVEDGVKALPSVDKLIIKYMKDKYAIKVKKIKDILKKTIDSLKYSSIS